jgi:hypothetical protein
MADVNISVFDSVTVAEYIETDPKSLLVYDSVTVVESVDLIVELNISVSETVTIVESVSVFSMHIGTDPRGTNIPIWEIDAKFADALIADVTEPLWELSGYLGALLDEAAPGWEIEATASEQPLLDVIGDLPIYSIEAQFGSELVEDIPVWQGSLTISYPEKLTLDKSMPGWKIDGSILPAGWLTLEKWSPVWIMEGTIALEDMATLDRNIPVWRITSTALSGVQLTLDAKEPIWSIDASVYSGNMTLDTNIPVWVLEGIGTGGQDSGGGYITDKSRFTDYVLRYVRP